MDSIIKLCLIFVYVGTCSADSDNEGIGNYSYISSDHCGIGHESSLTGNGMCFRWHDKQMVGNIENGRDVRLGEMPWLVRILYFDEEHSWHGSGSLLNERWIITAGHVVECIDANCSAENFRVLLANNTLVTRTDEVLNVSEVYLHHKYTSNITAGMDYYTYDVALLKLKHPVRFVKSGHIWTFNSICLPKINAFRHEKQYAIIAGIGSQQPVNDSSKGEAKMGWVRIHRTYNTSEGDVNGRLILFERLPFPTGTAFCLGDSGGPLLQYHHGRAVLVAINIAILSYGLKCTTNEDEVHISLTVSPLIPWITCTVLGHRDCSQYN